MFHLPLKHLLRVKVKKLNSVRCLSLLFSYFDSVKWRDVISFPLFCFFLIYIIFVQLVTRICHTRLLISVGVQEMCILYIVFVYLFFLLTPEQLCELAIDKVNNLEM